MHVYWCVLVTYNVSCVDPPKNQGTLPASSFSTQNKESTSERTTTDRHYCMCEEVVPSRSRCPCHTSIKPALPYLSSTSSIVLSCVLRRLPSSASYQASRRCCATGLIPTQLPCQALEATVLTGVHFSIFNILFKVHETTGLILTLSLCQALEAMVLTVVLFSVLNILF